jgi:FMN phosphatase YigB (HAD superfamily)
MSIIENKKVIIFELDDVLIPQKDYDLQVYYLFAHFIEYLESFPPANDLIEFIGKRYASHANNNMFNEVSNAFGIDLKYEENLKLLFAQAKLPLKLLLYKKALQLLQGLVVDKKQIFILTAGSPNEQLNKITQTEWNGLDNHLKVYFEAEFDKENNSNAFSYIIDEHQLLKKDILFVGKNEIDRVKATENGIDYIGSNEIII